MDALAEALDRWRIAQLYQVPLLTPHSLNVAGYQLLLRDGGMTLTQSSGR